MQKGHPRFDVDVVGGENQSVLNRINIIPLCGLKRKIGEDKVFPECDDVVTIYKNCWSNLPFTLFLCRWNFIFFLSIFLQAHSNLFYYTCMQKAIWYPFDIVIHWDLFQIRPWSATHDSYEPPISTIVVISKNISFNIFTFTCTEMIQLV